jgi:hypothetical protein
MSQKEQNQDGSQAKKRHSPKNGWKRKDSSRQLESTVLYSKGYPRHGNSMSLFSAYFFFATLSIPLERLSFCGSNPNRVVIPFHLLTTLEQ